MKTKRITLFLGIVIAFFAIVILFTAANVRESTLSAAAGDVQYTKVNVETWERLNAYLNDSTAYEITVTKDIQKESDSYEVTDTYNHNSDGTYYTMINSVVVKGNKKLHLDGHSITVSDKSPVFYEKEEDRHAYRSGWLSKLNAENSTMVRPYANENTLFTIGSGATLEVDSGLNNKGSVSFDSHMGDYDAQPCEIVRDVFHVSDGGKLIVYSGKFTAGREKKAYGISYWDDDWDKYMPMKTVTRSINGSAVKVTSGGTFISAGGEYYGHGITATTTGPRTLPNWTCHAALYITGNGTNVIIESGSFYGKCAAYSFYGKSPTRTANAYLKSECPARYTYVDAAEHGITDYDPVAHCLYSTEEGLKRGSDLKIDIDDNPSSGFVHQYASQTMKISPVLRTVDFATVAGLNENNEITVTQYDEITFDVNYEENAYWYNRSRFMSGYNATGGSTDGEVTYAYAIVKKNGNKTDFVKKDSEKRILRYAGTYDAPLTVKGTSEGWQTGGTYYIYVQATEKIGSSSAVVNNSMITVHVIDAKNLLTFKDCTPAASGEITDLGKRGVGSTLSFSFGYESVAADFTVEKSLVYRTPDGDKKNGVSSNGAYNVTFVKEGNYQVSEVLRLKDKQGNVLATKEQTFLVRAANDEYGINAVTEMAKIDTPDEAAQGEIRVVKSGGTPVKNAVYGDTVYLYAYPNNYCTFVRWEVTKDNGQSVSLADSATDAQNSFTMPSSPVTVKGVFLEKKYTLSIDDPEDDKAAKAYTQFHYNKPVSLSNVPLYTKRGYYQSGWVDEYGKTYNRLQSVRERRNVTLYPVWSEYKHSVYYKVSDPKEPGKYVGVFWDLQSSIDKEGNVVEKYNVRDEAYFAKYNYFDVQKLDYWVITSAPDVDTYGKLRDMDGNEVTFNVGDRLDPGAEIAMYVNASFSLVLEAVTTPKEKIDVITIGLPDGKKLQVGDNDFLPVSKTPGVELYDFTDRMGNAVTSMRLDPQEQKNVGINTQYFSFKARVTDNNVMLTGATTFVWPTFMDEVDDVNSFFEEPDCEVMVANGDPEQSMTVKEDFFFRIFPTCGKGNHTLSEEVTGPYYCIGDNNEYRECTVCHKVEVTPVAEAENPTFDELHTLTFRPYQAHTHTEDGMYQHYECIACGKLFVFTKGKYEERGIGELTEPAGHDWVDAYGTKTVMGVEFKMHWSKCIECGAVDEESYALHDLKPHESTPGTTFCSCGYEEACEHNYVLTITRETTCRLEGYIEVSCDLCGDSLGGYIIPKKDHVLYRVDEVKASCSHRGIAEHYVCVECGEYFLVDVYNGEDIAGGNVTTVDPNNYRAFCLEEKYPELEFNTTEALGEEWCNAHPEAVEIENTKNTVDALLSNYRLAGINDVQLLTGLIDEHKHGNNTEIRDAVAVTATTNGYSGDVYCLDCGTLVEQGHVIPAHEHACLHEDVYETDGAYHWHVCDVYDGDGEDVCREVLDKTAHTFGEWETYRVSDTEGVKVRVCSVCGYEEEEEVELDPEDPADPSDTPVPPSDTPVPPSDTPVPPSDTPVIPSDAEGSLKGGKLSGGAIAGIVIGSVFGALLIACAVLFLLQKKGVVKIAFLAKLLSKKPTTTTPPTRPEAEEQEEKPEAEDDKEDK